MSKSMDSLFSISSIDGCFCYTKSEEIYVICELYKSKSGEDSISYIAKHMPSKMRILVKKVKVENGVIEEYIHSKLEIVKDKKYIRSVLEDLYQLKNILISSNLYKVYGLFNLTKREDLEFLIKILQDAGYGFRFIEDDLVYLVLSSIWD